MVGELFQSALGLLLSHSCYDHPMGGGRCEGGVLTSGPLPLTLPCPSPGDSTSSHADPEVGAAPLDEQAGAGARGYSRPEGPQISCQLLLLSAVTQKEKKKYHL